MKIEVRCPACRKGFLVEEDDLDFDLVCPACSAPIRAHDKVAGEDETASADPTPRPGMRGAPGGSDPAVAVGVPAPVGEEDAVVCPRCKLHFVPRSSHQSARREDRPTVLVVEDMQFFQEIAKEALAPLYEVRTASSMTEARAALTKGGIDLMVLDLTLDGGDNGIELLRTMVVKPCPILIYTAKDESEMYGESWEELRELGADDLLIKGMNAGESLLRKVGALLGRDGDEVD
jgi:CheY-like chemotaxis protein/uncharacterized protein YbaR (Trm112 family)